MDQMINTFSDPKYLREQQYKTPKNLNARVSLHQRFRTNPYPWHRWVFDQMRPVPSAKIADIGCGPAYLWAENLERIPAGWSLQLLDLSFGMVASARESLTHREFLYSVADVQRLPLAANEFDAVVANHMLFHIPDLQLGLAEIRRILKLGGKFYASANGFQNLIEIWQWVAEALPSRNDIMKSRESVLGFSLENGEEQLLRHFSSVKLHRYPDSLEINEGQPLIDFVGSSNIQVKLNEYELSQYKIFLEEKLARENILLVTKDMGIFVAE